MLNLSQKMQFFFSHPLFEVKTKESFLKNGGLGKFCEVLQMASEIPSPFYGKRCAFSGKFYPLSEKLCPLSVKLFLK
jgi:hypothetical protein